jgi:transmembrane sensor
MGVVRLPKMSQSMDSSREIEQRAAEWLAKRDSGVWSDDDQAQLAGWLEFSIAHRIAFIRLEHGWQESLRLNALRGGIPPGTVPPRDYWRKRRSPGPRNRETQGDRVADARPSTPEKPSPLRWTRIALAACVLIAVAGGFGGYLSMRGTDYRTPIGGLASVPMTDGSKVTLNTASSIRVSVTEKERRVALEQGEAFFDVAQDPNRPFVVVAGNKRVIAVGTKFSVRRGEDDISVFVIEGKVRIEDESRAPAPLITAGNVARAGGAGVLVEQSSPADVENYLSWRTGFLVFTSTPLAEAVDEFNRYNKSQITIEDSALGAVLVSGKFRPTNFEGFVRLLESGYPIRVERSGGDIVLSERRVAN